MRHDPHQPRPSRETERKEWSRNRDREHPFEAREHARLPGKMRRTHGIRDADAALQIRELRARY